MGVEMFKMLQGYHIIQIIVRDYVKSAKYLFILIIPLREQACVCVCDCVCVCVWEGKRERPHWSTAQGRERESIHRMQSQERDLIDVSQRSGFRAHDTSSLAGCLSFKSMLDLSLLEVGGLVLRRRQLVIPKVHIGILPAAWSCSLGCDRARYLAPVCRQISFGSIFSLLFDL